MPPYVPGFPGDAVVTNPPASARATGVVSSIPGSGRSLEEEIPTYSSIPARKIPWTEEPPWSHNE